MESINNYQPERGEFMDFSCLSQQQNYTNLPSPPSTQFLSNEEFESLNKAVQLLRISQLRYIVHKYSIPASGNKTKLLNLVLSIFQSLRYDKVLVDILHEINNLLEQQRDAFSNPLAMITHLEIGNIDPSFVAPMNQMLEQSNEYLLGPINVPVGQGKGQFSFPISSDFNNINIDFLYPNGIVTPFNFQCEVNGFQIEISADDPLPQPLDISNLLNPSISNTIEIKMITATAPMAIVIRNYSLLGIQKLVNDFCHRDVDLSNEQVTVQTTQCDHTFDLALYFSSALAINNWCCPICKRAAQPSDLIAVQSSVPPPVIEKEIVEPGIITHNVFFDPTYELDIQGQDMFGNASGDAFKFDAFEWDSF